MKKTKMTEKGEVVLTDSPEEARTLQKSIPVIGICSPGSDKDWSGISFLADDWEDVDDEYAEPNVLMNWEDNLLSMVLNKLGKQFLGKGVADYLER